MTAFRQTEPGGPGSECKVFRSGQSLSEGYTEFESKVVEAFDVVCVIPVRSEAIIGCEMESEVILRKRKDCESDFRRDVEAPVVLSVDKGGHVGASKGR